MQQTIKWKSEPPETPGLYIASVDRHPGYVRAWTGTHWTAPVAVADLDLPGRMPRLDGAPARTWRNKRVEWLEPFVRDGDGFVRWSGAVGDSPVSPHALVDVRVRSGACTQWPVAAGGFHWLADGSALDPVAYRISGGVTWAA